MLRHEHGEGKLAAALSCRLLQYGLVPRFSTSRTTIFRERSRSRRARQCVGGRPPRKAARLADGFLYVP